MSTSITMEKLTKNPYFVYGISGALVIALGIIIYMVWFKNDDKENFGEKSQAALETQARVLAQARAQAQAKASVPPENVSTPVNVKPALVMFHMDGCGHCTNAMPAFIQAAENLVQSGQFSAIALENSKNPKEVREAGVTGFPVFRLYLEGFPGQNYVEYSGNRSTESLLRFAHSEGKDS